MQEAKEMAKRKIKQIEMEKREAARRASANKASASKGNNYISSSINPNNSPRFDNDSSSVNDGRTNFSTTTTGGPSIQTTSRSGKGMKLGKKTALI